MPVNPEDFLRHTASCFSPIDHRAFCKFDQPYSYNLLSSVTVVMVVLCGDRLLVMSSI